MNTIEKFKQAINEDTFKEKLKIKTKLYEAYINAICNLLNLKKTYYRRDNFEKILSLLDMLSFSHDERTEVIAYYINQCLNIYIPSVENEKIYFSNVFNASKAKYDFLCKNISKLRYAISENGEILPYNANIGIHEIKLFQFYVPIEDKYIKNILNLSKKRYRILFKEQQLINEASKEMVALIEKLKNIQNKINEKEIENVKKNMQILNYNEEQQARVLNAIDQNNNILLIKEAMTSEQFETNQTKEIQISYKEQKRLTFELSQYIDLNTNKPYGYLNEDQITEISNLLNLLGYPLEKVYIILNNIKKNNELEDERISNVELVLIKQDIFAEIDELEDKPFEDLANDIYTNALNNETMLEDKNEKINNALRDINEAINNIINAFCEEDKNIWVGYIIELLNDIDKEFKQAWEWNLVRARKES